MGADNLIRRFVPRKIAHLAARVDHRKWLTSLCVPKANLNISCTSAGCQQALLMRTPCNRFHGSRVLVEAMQRRI